MDDSELNASLDNMDAAMDAFEMRVDALYAEFKDDLTYKVPKQDPEWERNYAPLPWAFCAGCGRTIEAGGLWCSDECRAAVLS